MKNESPLSSPTPPALGPLPIVKTPPKLPPAGISTILKSGSCGSPCVDGPSVLILVLLCGSTKSGDNSSFSREVVLSLFFSSAFLGFALRMPWSLIDGQSLKV